MQPPNVKCKMICKFSIVSKQTWNYTKLGTTPVKQESSDPKADIENMRKRNYILIMMESKVDSGVNGDSGSNCKCCWWWPNGRVRDVRACHK